MPDGSQVGRSASATLLTLPNVITFARLCAVPLSVWLVLEQQFVQAFFLFVAAGASDAVDGWLARRNGGGNSVGALLDPVADKALLVTMYVTLAAVRALPDWLAILVVFRDVVIVGGVDCAVAAGPGGGDPAALRLQAQHGVADRAGSDDPAPVRLRPCRPRGDERADLDRRRHHAGVRRGLCLDHRASPMTEGAELPPPGPPPPVERRSWFPQPRSELSGQATRGQRVGLVVGLMVVAWLALQLFASVLAPFVAAAGIAYVLDPPTTRLTRLGLGRGIAALLVILALLAAVLLFALLLYPLILQQIGLLLGRIPQYVQLLQRWASEVITDLQTNFGSDVVNDKLRDLVSSQAGNMLTVMASALTSVTGAGFAIFNVLTLAVVTPVVGFYLLRDWPRVIGMVNSWLPHRYADAIRSQAREVDRILSAWVRGQALCCLILALYYASALTVAGLDLGLIVGMAAGLLSFIPYVGSISGGVTALGLALAQFPHWRGVIVIGAVLVAGQILEGYVLYPRFLGDRVELPAVWVIFALFAGGAAFGFLGVMLAVPVAATIGVLCRYWLRRYLASPLYLDPPGKQ